MTYLIEEDAGRFRNHGEQVKDGNITIFIAPSEKWFRILWINYLTG